MSILLYRLGRWAHHHHWRVIAAWLALLLATATTAAVFGEGTRDNFEIPGTESQDAWASMMRTFPQLAGSSATIVIVAPEGRTVDEIEPAVGAVVETIEEIPTVVDALSPFPDPDDEIEIDLNITADRSAAMVLVQYDRPFTALPEADIDALSEAVEPIEESGYTAALGGEVFEDTGPQITIVEALGVIVAFGVLLVTFGSVRAAVLPVATALVGVGITMGIVFSSTALFDISATAPLLALMIGLAVGIDYALFILSRQRDMLREGIAPDEATARAIATSGSAIFFAGLTTLIALAGLAIARIPFLTVMGLYAALAVALSVAIALTLLPALMGRAGHRLIPKQRTRKRAAVPVAAHWIRGVTRWPALTLGVLVLGLVALAVPGLDLRLALPDNGSQPPDRPERIAYDLVVEHFGPGFNGALMVHADIIATEDPLGVVAGLADDIARMDGVEAIGIATPNPTADTGIVQVIPASGPTDAETAELVDALRDRAPEFAETYGIETSVTGFTAATTDVSTKLGQALVPFGIVVVGLCLLVMAVVFRSWFIPLKTTLGYLLSVGASFGAVVAVFQWGWFADLVNLEQTGPVISFLPILLMAVLFGLAMDYEVFIVSRMQEEYASGRSASEAIDRGFAGSARVVTAAAVIMVSVFAAFVPTSDPNIKAIAFALTIGVLVDAFIVRMMLVPAAMKLMGDRAWRLPERIDRALPEFDVEGEEVRAFLALSDWPAPAERAGITGEGLRLDGPRGPIFAEVDLRVAEGDWLLVTGPSHSGKTSLLLALAGRMALSGGRLRVAGHLLPYGAHEVRRAVGLAEFEPVNALEENLTVGQHFAERLATFSSLPRPRRGRIAEEVDRLNRALRTAHDGRDLTASMPVAALTRYERKTLGVALALVGDPQIVVVDDVDALRSSAAIASFWDTLALLTRPRGITVVAGLQAAADGPRRSYATVVELSGRTTGDDPSPLASPDLTEEFVDS